MQHAPCPNNLAAWATAWEDVVARNESTKDYPRAIAKHLDVEEAWLLGCAAVVDKAGVMHTWRCDSVSSSARGAIVGDTRCLS